MPASRDVLPRKKGPITVPLFLVPAVIQDQIKKKGKSVFFILVERGHHHQYRVLVETSRELPRISKRRGGCDLITIQDVLDV